MENSNLWSRRKFSKAALSLQLLISSGILSFATGCVEKENIKKEELLGFSEQNILKLAMNEFIPNSNGMPSASEVGCMEYILDVFIENIDLVSAFQQVLSNLNTLSKDAVNKDFENLDAEIRVEVLKQFEKTQPALFNVLKNFVYEGYYINEEVWKLIEYEPYPTLSAGPKMEPFDENLLNKMKQMHPFYIKI